MSDAARASLWVSATPCLRPLSHGLSPPAGGFFIWRVSGSASGGGPPWLTFLRGTLLWWQALGLAVVFLLALLAVRYWSATPWLWLGALAANTYLAIGYLTSYIGLESSPQPGPEPDLAEVLRSTAFNDSYVTVFVLVGYPLAIGLGCWLGSRLLARQAGAQRQGSVSHA